MMLFANVITATEAGLRGFLVCVLVLGSGDGAEEALSLLVTAVEERNRGICARCPLQASAGIFPATLKNIYAEFLGFASRRDLAPFTEQRRCTLINPAYRKR